MVAERLRQARSVHAASFVLRGHVDVRHEGRALRHPRDHLRIEPSRHAGHLRRVEYSPTTARAKNPSKSSTSVIRRCAKFPPADPFPSAFPPEWKEGWKSWVASLMPGGEKSPSIKMLDDTRAAPYLVIKVNGVRIAARGGNWGMDDSRKRVSRERLEPYFRLHRDANLNIIRNWVGQNTEQVFYDLADEYGLMVWNDFWESTQNYNVEARGSRALSRQRSRHDPRASAIIRRSSSGAAATKACLSRSSTKASLTLCARSTALATTSPVRTR